VIDVLTLGKQIQNYRTAQGMSQNELAEDICFRSTVAQIEADRMIPSEEILRKMAEKLEIPLTEIMELRTRQYEVMTKLLLLRAFIEANENSKALELIVEMKQHGSLILHQQQELVLLEAEYLLQTSEPHLVIDCLLPLQERLEADAAPDKEMLTHLYLKLGKSYFAMSDTVNACTWLTKAYNTSKLSPALALVTAEIAYNLGRVWMKNGLSSGAYAYFKEAEAIYSQIIGPHTPALAPLPEDPDTKVSIEYH
jgi:transcriptional regulator with XRE-family HTH domain